MELPFVGPSYSLDSRPSSVQRTINMVPLPQEPSNERTAWVFKDVPGCEVFNAPSAAAPGWDSVNESGRWTFSNGDFTALATV